MKKLKILLIGQPNVGKSSLLNAIVGPRVTVSNYPGTTVETARAEKTFHQKKIIFEDTPGIYSISDRSEEEKVTEKALFEERADAAIVVADSVSLERSLYMALQILEAEIPIIMVLNFTEDAAKKGIEIYHGKLGQLLHIPVIPINPLTKKGINRLIDIVLKIKEITGKTFTVRYDDDIERAIDTISSYITGTVLPKRFVALRILEGDTDFYKYLKDKRIIEKIKNLELKEHPDVAEDIAITRYGTASFLAEKVTRIIPSEKTKNLEKKADNILLHKIWGPVVTTIFLLFTFGILLGFGNLIQGILMGLTESLLSFLGATEHSIPPAIAYSSGYWRAGIAMILTQGLIGLAAGVSIALPYVFLFYLLLGLLEDIGLLSRFIVNAGRFLKSLGLPQKAFIPLALGLGCTAPAATATRVLSSKQEQFHTAMFLAFIPCSSRTAIIMGIVGFYGGIILAFSVFATLLVAGLIWAFGIKKIIHIKSGLLLLELPPYRKPLIKNVLAKSWIRMKDFVYIVIPLLALGGIAYGILNILGLISVIVEPFSPITAWLGLPALTIIPLFFGFLQKDLTGAMLVSAFGTANISLVLTSLQIYTFGVATTIGIPCVIASGILIKEFGFKKAIGLTLTSIIYGFLIAGIVWRIISIL
ncbi:MAG: ferrous iron transport protein B [Deltaproteobacteria bacterium]|nr:ferrous iron transport protein B [Deltaproteobacteria bacterium]